MIIDFIFLINFDKVMNDDDHSKLSVKEVVPHSSQVRKLIYVSKNDLVIMSHKMAVSTRLIESILGTKSLMHG